MDTTTNSKLKEWLDSLQQESWQLELLISGFAIFLLLAVLNPLLDFEQTLNHIDRQNQLLALAMGIPYRLGVIAYFILLANLLLHVVFRGLWISTVGLRYVSGEIDFEQLGFHERYERFLRRRIGSFDRYIERLERICSILFGFTFLLIFATLGTGGFLVVLAIVQFGCRYLLGADMLRGTVGFQFDDVLILLFLLIAIIYMIDFFTLGWIKRRGWLGRIYYPIYRFMSYVTMANLYRPLYYNLIDNRFGRRLAYFVVPLIFLMAAALSSFYVQNPYFPYYFPQTVYQTRGDWVHSQMYEDGPETVDLNFASIPSRTVSGDYLPVFLPYLPTYHDKVLLSLCPDLQPARYVGLKFRGAFSFGQIQNADADPDQILDCLRQLWKLQIDDSTYQEVPLRFYYHPARDQHGLYGMIPIADLAASEHVLRIDRYYLRNDSLQWREGERLYFWKEE